MGYDTTLRDHDTTEEFVQSMGNDQSENRKTKSLEHTLHRFGLRVASDEGQYVASCYRVRHYQQAREFPQPGIQGPQPGKLQERESQMQGKAEKRRRLTGSTCTNTLRVVSAFEKTVDTTDRELKACLGRTRLRLCSLARGSFARAGLARFSTFARHCSTGWSNE